MKPIGQLFQLFLVAVVVFTLIDAAVNNTSAAAKEHRRKRRRCKCVQRFIDDVDTMIEAKLKRFEEKYFRPSLENQVTDGETISEVDRRLAKLDKEVAGTKDSLQRLTDSLETVKDQVLSQNQEVRQLAESFHHLDTLVRNLSVGVDILQNLIAENPPAPPSSFTALPVQTTASPDVYPTSCDEVYQQVGRKYLEDFYITIRPLDAPKPFRVLCNIRNNSGWTVIQRRQDGSVDFFRSWADYKAGFGSLEGEFWLGNDYIHWLTAQGDKMLRVELEDWGGRVHTATYSSFQVDDGQKKYKLHVSGYQGDAGDSLTSHWENHDGMPFSTKDRDNDGRYYDSCAQHYHGAWWFNNCFDSHLNGRYYTKGFHQNYFQRDGIQWNSIHQYSSLKRVVMMVKPKPQPPPQRSRRHV